LGEAIFQANYNQEPLDLKGRLYGAFGTYEALPYSDAGEATDREVFAICDTADSGSDYLCNIIYTCVGPEKKKAYIMDVYYTQEPMEVTERERVKRLIAFGVTRGCVEGNFGGKAWRRVIQDKYTAAVEATQGLRRQAVLCGQLVCDDFFGVLPRAANVLCFCVPDFPKVGHGLLEYHNIGSAIGIVMHCAVVYGYFFAGIHAAQAVAGFFEDAVGKHLAFLPLGNGRRVTPAPFA